MSVVLTLDHSWLNIGARVTLMIEVIVDTLSVNSVIPDSWTMMTYFATCDEIISSATFVMLMVHTSIMSESRVFVKHGLRCKVPFLNCFTLIHLVVSVS